MDLSESRIKNAINEDLIEAFDYNSTHNIISINKDDPEDIKVTVEFNVHVVPYDNYIGLRTY